MHRGSVWIPVLLAALLVALALSGQSMAQQKKLVYWTHWEQNPNFNKWYETRGKEFAKKTGPMN